MDKSRVTIGISQFTMGESWFTIMGEFNVGLLCIIGIIQFTRGGSWCTMSENWFTIGES